MWAEADLARAPLHDWPPRWCGAWGDDHFGAWAELAVDGAVQRLRWVEPGGFMMGSPEGEPGRYDDEGPRHHVRLSQGFWLADTPCTQGLWQAVMVDNPSKFKGLADSAERPVEQVSWDDVQAFFGKLRGLLPAGCEAVLPSEAQWEYACRAGAPTAYAWGDEMDDARANVEGKQRGTTPVKRYAPNAWGLYDMHGNVLEWCRDGMRDYAAEMAEDPEGPLDGPWRVVRGGAWFSLAAGARSAFRDHWLRAFRFDYLGFRLALRSPGPEGAEPPPAGGRVFKVRPEGAPHKIHR